MRVSGQLWYLIIGDCLIWRLTSKLPNHQIKTVAKISRYTIVCAVWLRYDIIGMCWTKPAQVLNL